MKEEQQAHSTPPRIQPTLPTRPLGMRTLLARRHNMLRAGRRGLAGKLGIGRQQHQPLQGLGIAVGRRGAGMEAVK